MAVLPAKTVTVEKVFRARCHLAGCPEERGPERVTFAEASADRQVHLDTHRTRLIDNPAFTLDGE